MKIVEVCGVEKKMTKNEEIREAKEVIKEMWKRERGIEGKVSENPFFHPSTKEKVEALQLFINLAEDYLDIPEGRDAYKLPFSDAEIEQEILSEIRDRKETANEYYRKGRNDEYSKCKLGYLSYLTGQKRTNLL